MKDPYQIVIIEKNDIRGINQYRKFLEQSPNSYFQQTLEWANVICDLGKDELVIIAIKENGEIIGSIPLYVHHSQNGTIINSVPYPGPLGGVIIRENHPEHETIFLSLVNAVDNLAQQKKCLLATIISSPFTPDHGLYQKHWQPNWELKNYTLYIDLTCPTQTTSHFRNNLKRMLQKAKDNKLIVKETVNKDEYNQWYDIHSKRHVQLDLEPIPKKLLDGFFNYLIPNKKGTFFIIKNQTKVVAGCFVAYHKDIIDTYIYSGNPDAYKNGAVYLLINYIFEWAKNSGFKIFNWQSSKPRGGGPYNFKMQWGSKETPYYFFTKKYGDIQPLVDLGLEKIKEEYEWHFVLPYSAFT